MKKFWRNLGLSILTIVIISLFGILLWAAIPAQPEDQAFNYMVSDQEVLYQEFNSWLVFQPNGVEAEIQASKQQLPDETIFDEIKDGNHAGFSWYRPKSRDGVAEISKNEQVNLIVESTVELLVLLSD